MDICFWNAEASASNRRSATFVLVSMTSSSAAAAPAAFSGGRLCAATCQSTERSAPSRLLDDAPPALALQQLSTELVATGSTTPLVCGWRSATCAGSTNRLQRAGGARQSQLEHSELHHFSRRAHSARSHQARIESHASGGVAPGRRPTPSFQVRSVMNASSSGLSASVAGAFTGAASGLNLFVDFLRGGSASEGCAGSSSPARRRALLGAKSSNVPPLGALARPSELANCATSSRRLSASAGGALRRLPMLPAAQPSRAPSDAYVLAAGGTLRAQLLQVVRSAARPKRAGGRTRLGRSAGVAGGFKGASGIFRGAQSPSSSHTVNARTTCRKVATNSAVLSFNLLVPALIAKRARQDEALERPRGARSGAGSEGHGGRIEGMVYEKLVMRLRVPSSPWRVRLPCCLVSCRSPSPESPRRSGPLLTLCT